MNRLVIAGALGLAVACANSPFECVGDHQCSLAGEPGVCVAGGQCAYPDADCPSGLAYPSGSSADEAGECVPGDSVSTGPSSTGSVSATSTTTATTVTPDVTVTMTDATDATVDPDSDTGPLGPDMGGAETGVNPCDDPFEPNDDPDQATVLELNRDCSADWEAVLGIDADADWYTWSEECSSMVPTTFVTEPPLLVCLLADCEDGSSPLFLECLGKEAPVEDDLACCDFGEVSLLAVCNGGPLPQLKAAVGSLRPAAECVPYQANLFY